MKNGPAMRAIPLALFLLVAGLLAGLPVEQANAQQATIRETKEAIKTYPFGDPDPVPNLYPRSTLYPYFPFDGYSHTGVEKEWTVVRMENPYISVSVLPEVGGKVWGALEKSTGREFVYKNDVLKFRDIATRGPWTSGLIGVGF